MGTVFFLKVLESLCKERNVKLMDLGFGDTKYKKLCGTTWADKRSLTVLADWFYPNFINFISLVMAEIWMITIYATKNWALKSG